MLVFFTKLSFIVFTVRCHFLVVEDYAFSQNTSHLRSVSLTLEYVRILSWSISFFSALIVSQMMFYVKLLSELMIVTLNSSCYKTSNLFQQAVRAFEL